MTQSCVNILGRVSRVYYDLCREKSKVCHYFCTHVVVPQDVGAVTKIRENIKVGRYTVREIDLDLFKPSGQGYTDLT